MKIRKVIVVYEESDDKLVNLLNQSIVKVRGRLATSLSNYGTMDELGKRVEECLKKL